MANQSSPVVRELADVFHDREEAVLLLKRSEFPMCRLPDFTTPLSFWSAVAEKACNGVLPGGIQRVIDTAARLYPENSMFRAKDSWDPSTTQRLMNSVVEPRFRAVTAPEERAQVLVPRRVDTGTAKAPIGRWATVVMSINSLFSAFSAFSAAVLLYALPLGPPPMLEPGPPGSPSHEEAIEIALLEESMEPEMPERGSGSCKEHEEKRGKPRPRSQGNGVRKGADTKRDADRALPKENQPSRTEDRVPVPGPDLPPRGKVSSKKKQQEWRQASKERKERRQKRKAQKRGEEEERGPRTDYAPRTSSVDALVCG